MELCRQYRMLHRPLDVTPFLTGKIKSKDRSASTLLYFKRPDPTDDEALKRYAKIIATINAEKEFRYRWNNVITTHYNYRNESIQASRESGTVRIKISRPVRRR